MRIAFLGLGGVGGYFAAKVSRQYSSSAVRSQVVVVCLAREKTAAAIRTNGIKLITPEEEFTARPSVVATNGKEAGVVDFVIVAVKSYDLESSLQQFRDCISPETVILPLLNGVDAEEKIRTMFPENDVWSGCVYIVSRQTAPGVITETGNIHKLHFGQSAVVQPGSRQSNEKCAELFRILNACHEDVFLHGNIREVVWEKFIFISTIASLTSYLDVCIGKILEQQQSTELLKQLISEVCLVARAEGILLADDITEITISKMRKLPYHTTSSMHSDFQKSGHTEYLSLTQYVVRCAAKHGITTPNYQRVLNGLEMRTEFTRV